MRSKGLSNNNLRFSTSPDPGHRFPKVSAALLGIIAVMCLTSPIWNGGNPTHMVFDALDLPPGGDWLFGTDTLGRDIFSMIWHGGRVSIYIGVSATVITALIAIVYGTISGLAGDFADSLMMRFVEVLLSIPSILYVISIQAVLGTPTATSIAVVIGLTSWMNISKMVRSEVMRVRRSEYVLSAKQMGGGFFYILFRHLLPNFIPAIMFMVVYNIGQAIATEATLSFLGIGLPTNVVSWGSLMALSEKALLTGSWWIIIIPGFFLVTTLVCITNLGEYYRRKNDMPQARL
ncbi:MAG: ABC transporter permease [Clostridiales Family XIII bacterium]|nr:ABC transporter permease [Clostridiales Family XIII bacterium]